MTSGFHRYSAEQFLDEFVEPDDRVAVVEAAARNTAEHFGRQLAELRRKAGAAVHGHPGGEREPRA